MRDAELTTNNNINNTHNSNNNTYDTIIACDDFPDDLYFFIYMYISTADFVALSGVCKAMHWRIFTHNYKWESVFRERYDNKCTIIYRKEMLNKNWMRDTHPAATAPPCAHPEFERMALMHKCGHVSIIDVAADEGGVRNKRILRRYNCNQCTKTPVQFNRVLSEHHRTRKLSDILYRSVPTWYPFYIYGDYKVSFSTTIYDILRSFNLTTKETKITEFDGDKFLEQTIRKWDNGGNFMEAEKYMKFREKVHALSFQEMTYYVLEGDDELMLFFVGVNKYGSLMGVMAQVSERRFEAEDDPRHLYT